MAVQWWRFVWPFACQLTFPFSTSILTFKGCILGLGIGAALIVRITLLLASSVVAHGSFMPMERATDLSCPMFLILCEPSIIHWLILCGLTPLKFSCVWSAIDKSTMELLSVVFDRRWGLHTEVITLFQLLKDGWIIQLKVALVPNFDELLLCWRKQCYLEDGSLLLMIGWGTWNKRQTTAILWICYNQCFQKQERWNIVF